MGRKDKKAAFRMIGCLLCFLMLGQYLNPMVVHADESKVEVINHVDLGAVVIKIEETQLGKNGKEEAFVQNQTILPGQSVSKIVRFRNDGEDAWIRARVEFTANSKMKEDITRLVGITQPNWIYNSKDGFWYYKKPLNHGEKVLFFDQVSFPSDWSSEYKGSQFGVTVHVDAVQKEHFTPDFDSSDPWYGTLIEQSLYDRTRDNDKTDIHFLVEYRGGAEGLIRKGDDFFSNWGTAMPGDTLTDTISVQNSYNKPIYLYFHTENIMDSELLKQLGLRIWTGDRLIYDGKMDGTLSEMLLSRLEPGAGFVMRYEVTVPAELTNKYAMSNAQTKWVFRAALYQGAKTGVEGTDLTVYLSVGLASLLIMILVIRKRNRKEAVKDE